MRSCIPFMNFLDYPDILPDSKTIWFFCERLSKTEGNRTIWNEFQRQLDSKGTRIKKGTAQDATFITSDPGHEKHDEARESGHIRRSKDGTFTRKTIRHSPAIRGIFSQISIAFP